MTKLSDKQLTDKAKDFFKANEDVDSIYMTDDGNIFLQKDLRYAQGHSHNTESGEVLQFFRSKVFKKKTNESSEVDNTDQESAEKKPTKKEKKEAKAKEEAEAKKKEEEEEAAGDDSEFEKEVERFGQMTPGEREKELDELEDDDDKKAFIEGVDEYLKENKPGLASDLPEKFQKPLTEMNEDELIDLAIHLGSENSQAALRKSKMEDIQQHCEDLAGKMKVELIK